MRRLLFAALLAATCAGPAIAMMLDIPLDEVAGSSDAIVRAQVTGMESRWLDEPRIIVTDVTLVLSEVWAGDLTAGNTLTVRINGGIVGEMGMRQEHEPLFVQEDDVVLFLVRPTPELEPNGMRAFPASFYRVNYVEQGKYVVSGETVTNIKRESFPIAAFRASVRHMAGASNR